MNAALPEKNFSQPFIYKVKLEGVKEEFTYYAAGRAVIELRFVVLERLFEGGCCLFIRHSGDDDLLRAKGKKKATRCLFAKSEKSRWSRMFEVQMRIQDERSSWQGTPAQRASLNSKVRSPAKASHYPSSRLMVSAWRSGNTQGAMSTVEALYIFDEHKYARFPLGGGVRS